MVEVPRHCIDFVNDSNYYDAFTLGKETESNKALQCLLNKYYGYVLAIANKYGAGISRDADISDAKDAYTDSLFVIWDKIRSGNLKPGPASLSTLLYRYTYCAFLKKNFKTKKHQHTNTSTYTVAELTDKEAEIIAAVEFEKSMEEKRKLVRKVIAAAGDDCEQLLLQKYYLKKTNAEIAAFNNKDKVHDITQKLFRCREKMAKLLIEKYNYPNNRLWL